MEPLEKDWAANVERINAKFEVVGASLEKKIVKMETYLLTANSKVKEITAGFQKEVVAHLQSDGGANESGAGLSSRGNTVSEDEGKSNLG